MGKLKLAMKWLLGALFVLAGIGHFSHTEFLMSIVPPYLPWHRELVYLSGIIEIALGILLLIPKFTTWAACGLIALLIAVFPANIHMAANPSQYPDFSPVSLWLRLPMQGAIIAWAYWFTRRTR